MTLMVENEDYTGYKWNLVVKPGDICKATLASTDSNTVTNRRMRRML